MNELALVVDLDDHKKSKIFFDNEEALIYAADTYQLYGEDEAGIPDGDKCHVIFGVVDEHGLHETDVDGAKWPCKCKHCEDIV